MKTLKLTSPKLTSTTKRWKTIVHHHEQERTAPPRYRVVTNIPGSQDGFWANSTQLHPTPAVPAWLTKVLGKKPLGQKAARLIVDFLFALHLLRKRRTVDAFITTSGTSALFFACLQSILPWGKKPHVMIDCLWYRFPSKLKQNVFSWMLRLAARSVRKFVVWESHEIEDYAKEFGVSPDKFEYVHFWHTLDGYHFDIDDNGYVFAGGNWNRDYPMLLDVARQMPDVLFVIGTTRPEQLDGCEIPPNVTVRGYSHEGFRQAIANCAIMVVPMVEGLLHTGGQQTVLNAMYMGKPVVAVGRPWASDLIHDGKTGCIVDFGDTRQLRTSLQELCHDDEYRHRMGLLGMIEAKAWPPLRSLEQIYRLALGLNEFEPIL